LFVRVDGFATVGNAKRAEYGTERDSIARMFAVCALEIEPAEHEAFAAEWWEVARQPVVSVAAAIPCFRMSKVKTQATNAIQTSLNLKCTPEPRGVPLIHPSQRIRGLERFAFGFS